MKIDKVERQLWESENYRHMTRVGSQEFLISKIKNLESAFTDFDWHACRNTSKPPLKLKGKVNLKQQINWH